jgi:hypothetical protein
VDFFFGMANIELKKSFLVKKREMLMWMTCGVLKEGKLAAISNDYSFLFNFEEMFKVPLITAQICQRDVGH